MTGAGSGIGRAIALALAEAGARVVVADIQAAHADLKARGVPFEGEPHVVGKMGTTEVWMVHFRDCEQHLLAIMEERSA